MEVHHHPQTSGKKWTHYFWEFLMLFLAVTLGFFVENQREHYIEHQREKQYMRSMIEDLKFDTSHLASSISFRNNRIKMIDSLIFLLSSDTKDNGNDIYYFGRSITPPLNFFPNDRTIQQLKSSGGLRLIRKPEISNEIMAYDQKLRTLLFEQADEIELRAELRQNASEVFDGKTFSHMIENNKIDKPVNNPLLITTNVATINKFIVSAQYLKKLDQNQSLRASEMKNLAADLIAMIKKEYHLE